MYVSFPLLTVKHKDKDNLKEKDYFGFFKRMESVMVGKTQRQEQEDG